MQAWDDAIITEGFPEGWFVQDRCAENEALLCRKVTWPITGSMCVCVRPRAISTKEWLPTARDIASGLEIVEKMENERRSQEACDLSADGEYLADDDSERFFAPEG